MASSRAVVRVAAAGASGAVVAAAECREWTVSDGSSSWTLLEPQDIDEASTLVETALPSNSKVAAATMSLAKRMASRPGVQAALAEELGISRPAIDDTDLRAAYEKLSLENDALKAAKYASDAALAARTRDDAATLMSQQLATQNEALAASFEDLQGEVDAEEIVEANTTEGDAALAAALAAEDQAREDQEKADFVFAEHLASLPDTYDKLQNDPPVQGDGSGAETTDSPSLVEIALALCGLIIVVAMTRKVSPTLAKRAAALSAAALAGFASHFKRF